MRFLRGHPERAEGGAWGVRGTATTGCCAHVSTPGPSGSPTPMLDEAVAACDPEQQARDVDQQATFVALLEPALGPWPGVSARSALLRAA